ncbi:hypothetical protein ACFSSA_02940 [Luteolibacter algae]|uniref:Uncharacterized protein n=1 Tax=Luteolibacter algae TaxID=454151 RepID=A0ABW5D4I8_9BACT
MESATHAAPHVLTRWDRSGDLASFSGAGVRNVTRRNDHTQARERAFAASLATASRTSGFRSSARYLTPKVNASGSSESKTPATDRPAPRRCNRLSASPGKTNTPIPWEHSRTASASVDTTKLLSKENPYDSLHQRDKNSQNPRAIVSHGTTTLDATESGKLNFSSEKS